MSSVNGDKSRFNIKRKKKIAARKRNQELLKGADIKQKSPSAPKK